MCLEMYITCLKNLKYYIFSEIFILRFFFQSHKDLYSMCSKIGKTIDKNFNSSCSSVYLPEILRNEDCHKLFNIAICEHLYKMVRKDSMTFTIFEEIAALILNSIIRKLKLTLLLNLV